MPVPPVLSHDVMLASYEGERAVLLALWQGLSQGLGALLRRATRPLARGLALMPGPHSLR